MSASTLAWIAVAAYALVTLSMAVRGLRRTRGVAAYAVGNRDIPPTLVGLALTAQLTSVATFVINPGLVFHSGVAALMGFGVAAGAGITAGLLIFSARFRRVGSRIAALTLPQWIGRRYESSALRHLFSTLSLGLIAYAVLIIVALSLVLSTLLGIAAPTLAIVLTLFVVGCVAIGGANGHAWMGAVQACVMLVVALLLIGKGLPSLLDGGLFAELRATDAALVSITNPKSFYFRNLFEVFVCNFGVGLALVCQPHIVSKALYLKDDRQVRTYLATAVVAGMVFLAVLLVGLYARAVVPAGTPIDQVVPVWIATAFSPAMQVAIVIGLLAAGMSTLEGILLALASIASIDVFPAVRRLAGAPLSEGQMTPEESARALRFGRLSLLVVAGLTIVLARGQIADPTGGSVAIFAQYGVYLLFTGAFLPLACGMFVQAAGRRLVTTGVVVSLAVYVAASVFGFTHMANNPAFLATVGMAAGWVVIGAGLLLARRSRIATCAPAASLSRSSA
jgi:sodium/pantothenate symporter